MPGSPSNPSRSDESAGKSGVRPLDEPEIVALESVYSAIGPLAPDAQQRIIDWLLAKLGIGYKAALQRIAEYPDDLSVTTAECVMIAQQALLRKTGAKRDL